MSKLFRLAITLILVAFSTAVFAQNVILGFEDNEGNWIRNNEDDTHNVFTLADNYDEAKEGDASLEITAKFRFFPNDWGTYTEAIWEFDSPIDGSGYDEMRFWVKILEAPTQDRAIQWSCCLSDLPADASGKEVFQWDADQDLLYGPVDEWFEVVIPFNRLLTPEWMSVVNGTFDTQAINSFEFGVHGDSTALDSVRFVIDNLMLTKSNQIGDMLFGFEENIFPDTPDSVWTIWTTNDDHGIVEGGNIFELTDNYDDPFEGDGCLQVRCVMDTFPEEWGAYAEAMYFFPEPVDITGATEIRFYMDILEGAQGGIDGKNLGMSISVEDAREGVATEGWVSNDRWGIFLEYAKNEGWNEFVWPFAQMYVPDWVTPENNILDLEAISKFSFTVGGNGAATDSVLFLMDNLYATNANFDPSHIGEPGAPLTPNQFELSQNYPNPFNPTTTLRFALNSTGPVNLKIYNNMGQLVKTVINNKVKIRGTYELDVDMSDMASGLYHYVLEQNGSKLTKKMTLLK